MTSKANQPTRKMTVAEFLPWRRQRGRAESRVMSWSMAFLSP
jgi:hypothetical protein